MQTERNAAIMRHFGLDADRLYFGDQHQLYAQRIKEAVEGRRLFAVIGAFGSGKSVLVNAAAEYIENLDYVYVNQPDKEHLRIGQIVTTLICKLSTETPRRDNTTRVFQLERIVGERVVNQKRHVAVVIDNAHRMHANTLLALKDLRESANYKQQRFLFSVILIGQEPLRAKLQRFGEVFYRTRTIDLATNGWMSRRERSLYLAEVYGAVLPEAMRERLALLFKTPLELDHFIEGKLDLMRAAGLDVLDDAAFPLTIREQREALKLSLPELEKKTKIPRAILLDIEQGRDQDQAKRAQIQETLDNLAAEQSLAA